MKGLTKARPCLCFLFAFRFCHGLVGVSLRRPSVGPFRLQVLLPFSRRFSLPTLGWCIVQRSALFVLIPEGTVFGMLGRLLFFFFYFISLIADGPHHYHPACGHKGSSHLSPVHALQFFYRDASSALLQLVNQWLNFTFSRSHAFRCERKNTNPTLVRIELTTSVLADVQLTYYTTRATRGA